MPYRTILGGALLAMLIALPAANAAAQAPSTALYLQESATRDVPQNVLVATVQAHAEAEAPGDAQAAVNRDMAAAVERVQAVAEVKPATGSYSVYQRRDRDNKAVGWVAQQDLRLTSQDPAKLLELLGALQEMGLNMNGLGWQVDEATRRKVQDELTIEAIAALRERAEAIAKSVDMRVGNIDKLRVGGAMQGPAPMMTMRAEAMAAAPPPTALPDEETIRTSVEAEITLSPK
ncbi:MAG: SIMPL domain-containing protein [Pseudomonadota bacterium]